MKKPPYIRDISACLIIAALIISAYWQVQGHDFINFDDDIYITRNTHIQNGLSPSSVGWAFTDTHVGLWIPLTWLSFMLDFSFYGLDAGGYHLTNVLFHVLNSFLLFIFLRLATGQFWPSALVAGFFALHPLRVESVAWATERKDVLSTFFFMLTLFAYFYYTKSRTYIRYFAVFLCFTLGLMAKPMLVTLPVLLLLLDHWPLRRWSSPLLPLILEKIPLFMLSAGFGVITLIAEKAAGSMPTLSTIPFDIRIGNAVVSCISYLEKMFWPQNLTVLYPHPGHTLSLWQAAFSAAVIGVIFFFAVRAAKSRPYFIVGWLWYLVSLSPVLGLLQAGSQAMADRFTYIPLIGPFILVSWGLYEMTKNRRHGHLLFGVIAGILIVVLASITAFQTRYWRDSVTLFTHTLNVTSRNYVAHINLGIALAGQGDYHSAAQHFQEGLRINPQSEKAHNYLGLSLTRQGKYDEAVSHFQKALRIKPDFAEAHNNLGIGLARAGKSTEAVTHFTEALRIRPDYEEARNNLARLLRQPDLSTE